MREVEMNLDLKKTSFQPLYLRQGDPVTLLINLFDDGEPYKVSAESISIVVQDRIQKKLVEQKSQITSSNNLIRVNLEKDFLPSCPRSGFEVVMNENGKRHSTFVVPLIIETSLSMMERMR